MKYMTSFGKIYLNVEFKILNFFPTLSLHGA